MNKDTVKPAREINRRLLLTLHQDGLFDILGGIIVIAFGLVPVLDETGLTPGLRQVIILLFYGLGVGSIFWLKQTITLPRTGFVRLLKRTSNRMSLVLLLFNVALFLLFAITFAFKIPLWELFGSYQLSVPLGMIFLIMLTVSGALLRAPRFYLYGILVFVSFVFFEHLTLKGIVTNHGIPAAAFTSGGFILGTGIIILIRFIKKYKLDIQ